MILKTDANKEITILGIDTLDDINPRSKVKVRFRRSADHVWQGGYVDHKWSQLKRTFLDMVDLKSPSNMEYEVTVVPSKLTQDEAEKLKELKR